jgi:hypothetical protein
MNVKNVTFVCVVCACLSSGAAAAVGGGNIPDRTGHSAELKACYAQCNSASGDNVAQESCMLECRKAEKHRKALRTPKSKN